MKLGRGDFSKLSILATERADFLQQLAVARIAEDFNVETDRVDLRTMTYQDFLNALATAEKNGTREEFEADLARQLLPIIQMAMQPQQGGVSGGTVSQP